MEVFDCYIRIYGKIQTNSKINTNKIVKKNFQCNEKNVHSTS